MGHRLSGRPGSRSSVTIHTDGTCTTDLHEETWDIPGAPGKLMFNEELLERHLHTYSARLGGSRVRGKTTNQQGHNHDNRNHPLQRAARTRGPGRKPPAVFLPNENAAERFFGFFTANHQQQKHAAGVLQGCLPVFGLVRGQGASTWPHVKPPHVAAYIEMLAAAEPEGPGLSKPSVKQHLAALRMLFDWLVVGHVLDSNPAHAVRGPKYSQKKGKTPVLDRDEARALIAAIDTGSLTGLRDRALIGIMVYTFARVGAVLQMNVGDYFSQGRRGWVRLHEKGGKEHEAPCIPKLEAYLDEYIAAAGIADDKDGPLFRTTGRSTGTPHRMTQQDAYRLIQRHAKRAGIKTRIGNHSMRATGITDYLKSDGSLSEARKMANHADTRARTDAALTTRSDSASLRVLAAAANLSGWKSREVTVRRSGVK